MSEEGRAKLTYSGGCQCGAVRFSARGAPEWTGICHCSSCRKATGGALVAGVGFKIVNVLLTGESLKDYASSPGVTRQFCDNCGTSIAYKNIKWADDIHLMAGAFDHPERLQPDFHLFSARRLPWLCVDDGLVRYRGTPSEGDIEEG